MAAKDINIRLGLIFDQKSLARVESQLRRSGEKLNRFGDALSLSISAPLLALGASSIKAAGDLESLTLALESNLGSTAAAKKELAALTEVAKNPGLGLEQVVRGSVSLQSVGRSAESAREILSEFGNALARAGKGRAEMDGVVLALTQITAKGKVSAEEINQLAERLPQIRTLMKQAFGTASTEEIQKLGITSEQFIDGILVQLKQLPRAAGGIKNSLENALDSLKQSLGKLGLAINKVFNVAGAAEGFSNFVFGLADGFSKLEPSIQSLIVGLGGVLLAAGPVAKVFGSIQLIGAQLIGVWSTMIGVLGRLATWLDAAGVAFNALNAATRAFVVIGVISAVVAIAAALGAFNRELTTAEKTQRLLNDVNKEAARAISEEKAAVEPLIATLRDETKSREQKAAALQQLNKIAPEYFGNLKAEEITVDQVNAAYDRYIENLLRAARAKAAEEKLIANDREALELAEKRARLAETSVKSLAQINSGLGANNNIAAQAAATQRELIATTDKEIEANAAKKKALIETIQANTDLVASQKVATATTITNTKANTDATKALKDKAKAQDEYWESLRASVDALSDMNEQEQGAETAYLRDVVLPKNDLPMDGGGLAIDPTDFGQALENLGPGIAGVTALGEAFATTQAASDSFWTSTTTLALAAADSITNFGQSLASSLERGALSFQQFAQAAISAIGDVIGQLIKLAVAEAIARSMKIAVSALGPLGVAVAGAAGTLAGSLFKKLVGGAKYARGTQFASGFGGMALVGEQGPELMNVPRGSAITNNARTNRLLNGMGGNSMEVFGTIRANGSELVVFIERAQQKQKRMRGF